MGEITSNGGRNFDLNIVPGLDSVTFPIIDETMLLNDWSFHESMIFHDWSLDDFIIMDDWSLYESMFLDDMSLNLDLPLANSGNGSELQAAEGTVADEERAAEVPKASEICNDGVGLDKTSEKEGDGKGGGSSDDARFFDCNICFDMAKDPIVTCCGHLFCWPCIYRWLDMGSKIKGCPVCKGEVTVKNVTPIYGSGNDARVHEEEENSNLNIPLRPNAKRLERRKLDLNLELVQPYELGNAGQGVERSVRRISMFERAQWNSAMHAAERLGRNQEHPPLVDEWDYFPSIAAGNSSSRRRNDAASSLSDVDSGDSPSPMRRRLNC